jgi:hypothetical protein
MNTPAQRRGHDLFWAGCIVLGFGVLLATMLQRTWRDELPQPRDSQLAAEGRRAIALGDEDAADDVMDYEGARQAYRHALDLLRAAGDSADPGDDLKVAVRVKIIRTYLKEKSFEKASDELDILRRLYPAAPGEGLAELEREIRSGLGQGPSAPAPPRPASRP